MGDKLIALQGIVGYQVTLEWKATKEEGLKVEKNEDEIFLAKNQLFAKNSQLKNSRQKSSAAVDQ